jgi:hypothetical protein
MNKLLIATLAASLVLCTGRHGGAQTPRAGLADTPIAEQAALPSADVDTPGSPPSISARIGGREVQLHGYLSVGYASSTDNNYLRMETSRGSAFTESGLTVSSQITNKFRVGAQVYNRYIGELGKGRVYLDWAYADYRLRDWIGFRGGKIKTPLGLYTDTQDQTFLHTWALLPQSLYPVDLRSVSVAHVGGDIYGNVSTARGGSLAYTGFAGSIPSDPRGGFLYGLQAQGAKSISGVSGRMAGIDLRWNSPLAGLMAGTSVVYNLRQFKGTLGPSPVPLSYSTTKDRVMVVYGEYAGGNFRANAEYRDQTRRAEITAEVPGRPVVLKPGSDEPAWFVSGAYRLSKRIETGGYYSRYHVTLINPVTPVTGIGRDHIHDRVVTMRFDLAPFWVFKIEGHFMDGVGAPGHAHGFYPQDNPQGLELTTRLLVLRTSWYF